MKATWKWTRSDVAYLTAPGESSACPRARVYAVWGRPRGTQFIWSTVVNGQSVAVSRDTRTAMRIGREFSEETP